MKKSIEFREKRMTNMDEERNSKAYQNKVLEQKTQDDPKEQTIREKIRASVLAEAWAQGAFEEINMIQIEALKHVVAHVGDEKLVHDELQTTLKELSTILRAKVIEGDESLRQIPRGSPVLIATNHFGAYKLCGVDPRLDIGVDIEGYDAMYPYPMYFAALYPVAEMLGDNLYYASNDFPGVFGDVHSKAGFIHVPALAESKTAALIEQTRMALEKHPNAAIVNFPEGTTSGKPTGGGPYDLNPFKTGGYVVAGTLGIHVVPVAQYFHPHEGFQLRVFDPIIPKGKSKEEFEQIAEGHKTEMRAWFNEQLSH